MIIANILLCFTVMEEKKEYTIKEYAAIIGKPYATVYYWIIANLAEKKGFKVRKFGKSFVIEIKNEAPVE